MTFKRNVTPIVHLIFTLRMKLKIPISKAMFMKTIVSEISLYTKENLQLLFEIQHYANTITISPINISNYVNCLCIAFYRMFPFSQDGKTLLTE